MSIDLDTWRKASIQERWSVIQKDLDDIRLKSQKQRAGSILKVFDIIDKMPKKDQPPGMLVNLWLACKEGDGLGIDKNLETLQKLSQVRSQVAGFIPGTQKASTSQTKTPNKQVQAGKSKSLRSH